MTSRGKHRAGSSNSKLYEFFSNNPDEELTFEEACIKFDLKKTTLSMAISRLREEGFLEVVTVMRKTRNPPIS